MSVTVNIMPWGKFQGRSLDRCPLSYLEWVVKNVRGLDPILDAAIREEVHRRQVAMAAAVPPDHPRPEVGEGDGLGDVLRKLAENQKAQVALLKWATENRQLPAPLADHLWDLLAGDHALADRLARIAADPPHRCRTFELLLGAPGVN